MHPLILYTRDLTSYTPRTLDSIVVCMAFIARARARGEVALAGRGIYLSIVFGFKFQLNIFSFIHLCELFHQGFCQMDFSIGSIRFDLIRKLFLPPLKGKKKHGLEQIHDGYQ